MAKNALMGWSVNRNVFLVFLLGKTIRYFSYFGFLYFLVRGSNGFLGYNQNQVLFITATYIFIDTVAQFFFRSVYTFRSIVVSGDLDLILIKPVNALFRVLLGGPDPIDFVTIPPILFVVIWIGSLMHPTTLQVLLYILLLINGLLISAAFHIVVLSIGVITLEVDYLVMVYRDLSSMGRFPIDIYKQPLKGILTFVVPIGLMVSVPAKAFSGLLSPISFVGTIAIGIIVFILSLKFWNYALTKYTSASS
ncbi:MAG TPA: ABC-2 family transporter protein [Patescibacteria group bacterium]|nr:ABC-2 family transporter protein [Patescibacteria group bacterium]